MICAYYVERAADWVLGSARLTAGEEEGGGRGGDQRELLTNHQSSPALQTGNNSDRERERDRRVEGGYILQCDNCSDNYNNNAKVDSCNQTRDLQKKNCGEFTFLPSYVKYYQD